MIDHDVVPVLTVNERAVHAMYDAERRRDIDAWAALWHQDGRQTFPFAPEADVIGQDGLIAVTQRKFDIRPPYEIHVHTEPFADPARILARLRLVIPGADPDQVHIWCIFHFDDAGLIVEVEEMLDTASGPTMPR